MNRFTLFVTINAPFNADRMDAVLDRLISEKRKTHEVCIAADTGRGLLALGLYAKARGFDFHAVPGALAKAPTSELQTRSAARRRAELESADGIIAFWNGEPGQTERLIQWAKAEEKPIRVVQL